MDVKWFPRFNCLVVELHFPILGNWKFGGIPIYTSVSWKCRTCFFLAPNVELASIFLFGGC